MIPFLMIALLSAIAQLFLPWWVIAVVAFTVCFWRKPSGGRAFLSGFLGIGLVWLLYALLIHLRTDGLLTARMAELLFKSSSPALLLLVTLLIGGLVGGFAGVAGSGMRQVFSTNS
ncbi:hypothetical protein [Larkinella soli]|uniref:hypothetical protein n=1 Tax=Larkinella soli TaxID=1770527 RepID=UPI000FFC77DC|nr:hypothetical protein [Larkinella soli]